jgi:hypothetical protein
MKMHMRCMDLYTLETRKWVVTYDIGGGLRMLTFEGALNKAK